MQTFDDVLSQLVALLRRSDSGGFVPHSAKAARTASRRSIRPAGPVRGGAGLASYRDIYRCPSSTWGASHLSECPSARERQPRDDS